MPEIQTRIARGIYILRFKNSRLSHELLEFELVEISLKKWRQTASQSIWASHRGSSYHSNVRRYIYGTEFTRLQVHLFNWAEKNGWEKNETRVYQIWILYFFELFPSILKREIWIHTSSFD